MKSLFDDLLHRHSFITARITSSALDLRGLATESPMCFIGRLRGEHRADYLFMGGCISGPSGAASAMTLCGNQRGRFTDRYSAAGKRHPVAAGPSAAAQRYGELFLGRSADHISGSLRPDFIHVYRHCKPAVLPTRALSALWKNSSALCFWCHRPCSPPSGDRCAEHRRGAGAGAVRTTWYASALCALRPVVAARSLSRADRRIFTDDTGPSGTRATVSGGVIECSWQPAPAFCRRSHGRPDARDSRKLRAVEAVFMLLCRLPVGFDPFGGRRRLQISAVW